MATSDANDKQVGGSHYKKQKIQHWDLVVANDIPYLDAQVLKYVMRHRDKNGKQDLQKAVHFIEKMLEVYYPERRIPLFGECPVCWAPEGTPCAPDVHDQV